MTEAAAPRATMTSLARLVDHRRIATGKSYRAIAAEAGVALSTVHKIANGKLTRVPSPRTIDGLARALDVPAESLIQAAVADVGLREYVIEEGAARAIYIIARELSEADRDFLLSMANKLRNAGSTS